MPLTTMLALTILSLAVCGSQAQDDFLDNLFRKLKPLGESDSPLTLEAEENICTKQSHRTEIDNAAATCAVPEEDVNYLGVINVDGMSQEESQNATTNQLCIHTNLGWINIDSDGLSSLNAPEIYTGLENTVLGDNAASVVEDCLDLSEKVTFDNVRTFARTGEEDDLTADDPSSRTLTEGEQRQRDQLVRTVANFVFFNCLRREFEAVCLVEANCQLENLQTPSDQCLLEPGP